MAKSTLIKTAERGNEIRRVYCYIVDVAGSKSYLTNYNEDITIVDGTYVGEYKHTATFTHGPIKKAIDFQDASLTFQIPVDTASLRNAIMTSVSDEITVTVLRVTSEKGIDLDSHNIVRDQVEPAWVGIGSSMQWGDSVGTLVTIRPSARAGIVPKMFWQRQDNRTGNLVMDTGAFQTEVNVISIRRTWRELVIDTNDIPFLELQGGFLRFNEAEVRIRLAAVEGPYTRLSLGAIPNVNVGDEVTIVRGYDGSHTTAKAIGVWTNFNGLPWIPKRNPVTQGV